MKIRLHAKDLEEVFFEQNYPAHYRIGTQQVLDQTFNAQLVGAKGYYREILLQNMRIGYADFKGMCPLQFSFESDFETVEMHFALQGASYSTDFENKHRFEFEENYHNIVYTSNFRGESEMYSQKGVKFFEINFNPNFFVQYLGDDCNYFYQFLKNVQDQKNGMIYQKNFPITPEMYLAIQEILGSQREGMLKKMFLEAKVIELLMLQLEQISRLFSTTSLKPSDQEKIYAVKDILDKQIHQRTSLIDLARQVGTNEFTLKKGFKELFGTTVFGYWNDLKMRYAQKMLLEQNTPIYQVAEAIGYKNPQHFTTAFKRKYGIVPSAFKK